MGSAEGEKNKKAVKRETLETIIYGEEENKV